jgi:hypothetical protein
MQAGNQCVFKVDVLTVAMLCLLTLADGPAIARGGFGGDGFRGGGGFRGGDFAGRDFDRDFGDMGSAYARDFDRGGDDMMDRLPEDMRADRDSGVGDMGAAMDRPRADDTGLREWGDDARSNVNDLATDGGFGRIMDGGAFRALSPARNSTYHMTPADLAGRAGAVRQSFNHYDWFNHNWWQRHAGWWNPYWGNLWAWRWAGWADLAGWWGLGAAVVPVYYDYGDNITYQDDTVYYGSQPLESADQYYQQAQSLALSAPQDDSVPATPAQQQAAAREWKPLGVFALVENSAADDGSQMMQLAVNQKGIIRGNYYNAVTDQTTPIHGAVDKKSMRACWTIGNNKNVVYDTGVGNLMKDQSPILVHYGKSNTQQWMLVRLKNPSGGS